MNNTMTTSGLHGPFSVRMRALATLAGILISLLTPTTYFFVQWNEEANRADLYGSEVAKKVSLTVRSNPELWQYSVQKFMDIFAEEENSQILEIRIMGQDGRMLDHSDYRHSFFFHRTGGAAIFYNNQVYGKVEVDVSLERTAIITLILFAAFLVLGTACAALLYHFPSRTVQIAEQRIDSTLQDLHQEIHERSENQARLTQVLKEREILFQELHHRVKNNLQIIISLIKLRIMGSENPEVHAVLANLQAKVFAMARVHEFLYQCPEIERIEMKPYLEGIVTSHGQDFNAANARITYDIDVDPLFLAIDHALPIGLIVAELLMNSLKHAFLGKSEGRIGISLKRQPEGQCLLRVADDGVGPQEKVRSFPKPLGMRLINALAVSLGGNPEIHSGSGYAVTILMKKVREVPPADNCAG